MVVLALSSVAFTQEEGEFLFCENFDSQAEAQRHLREDPSDPDELDEEEGEDDGIAGETFPYDNPEKDLNPVAAAIDQLGGQSQAQPRTTPSSPPRTTSPPPSPLPPRPTTPPPNPVHCGAALESRAYQEHPPPSYQFSNDSRKMLASSFGPAFLGAILNCRCCLSAPSTRLSMSFSS